MPRKQFTLSGYSAMWLFVMFDLPVTTSEQRKKATKFRKLLLDDGFSMLQFSVYARYCASDVVVRTHKQAINKAIPEEGYVRFLAVTDRQFGSMESFIGLQTVKPEKDFEQLTFF